MPHVFSVSELTRAVKDVIEAQFPFVWVRGQVANLSRPGSGHIYFSLGDGAASLAVVWFKNLQQSSPLVSERVDPATGEVTPGEAVELADGMEVLCAGRLGVYAPRGSYQLVAELVQTQGVGAGHMAFEALKHKLEGKGYFAEARKRPLPANPSRVAVVTAPRGAAIRDFLKVAADRGLGGRIRIFPTLVQGETAPGQIAEAMARAAEQGWAEVIVLIRGGGSLEDLWAFNTEAVADAVFAAPVPVAAGIGHEKDVSLADLVADARAATPTHAAQLLWPERLALAQALDEADTALGRAFARLAANKESALNQLAKALGWLSPATRLAARAHALEGLALRLRTRARAVMNTRVEMLNRLTARLGAAFGPHLIADRQAGLARLDADLGRAWQARARDMDLALERLAGRLAARDPEAPLARGYALVQDSRTGELVKSVAQAREGQDLDVALGDGRIHARVRGKTPKEDA